jgi:hypothetical protein
MKRHVFGECQDYNDSLISCKTNLDQAATADFNTMAPNYPIIVFLPTKTCHFIFRINNSISMSSNFIFGQACQIMNSQFLLSFCHSS